jgi:threonine dehydratase
MISTPRRRPTLDEIAAARDRLAAALCGEQATGNIVCVISGGNIDAGAYAQVLAVEIPSA